MWQVIGASVIGTSHVRSEKPCQDAHLYRQLEDSVIAAVADGLGSAEKSEEGSRTAVQTIVDHLEAQLAIAWPIESEAWKQLFVDGFEDAREALRAKAEAEDRRSRDYGTTLLVAVLWEGGFAAAQIGDGAIVSQFEDGSMQLVFEPQGGEFANQTYTLTMGEALPEIRFTYVADPPIAAALFTDGIQRLCINDATTTPHEPFFRPMFEGVIQPIDTAAASEDLGNFLASERVCAKTDDDKTCVLIGRACALGEAAPVMGRECKD